MAKIDNAYEYYVANYSKSEVSRYDSHKKSELRKVYNRIVKSNKESPLYKLSNADEAKRFAIDIKENAKSIQNVVAELSEESGSLVSAFQKKVAISSDEDSVAVKYIGDGTEDNQTEQFDIRVNKLATPQVNTGNYIKNDGTSLLPGSYSFDLNTNMNSYEFQFNVNLGETNRDTLNKLANLVNNSNLGIIARVLDGDDGTSALELTSKQTGLSENEESLFSIVPQPTQESITAINVLGINNISKPASNSSFTLNDAEHSSLSNTFTINNTFELTLKNANTDSAATHIGFKTNTDTVADNIQTLVNAYNNILSLAENYSNSGASAGNKLLNDMSTVSKQRQGELEYIGLMVDKDGSISLDKNILSGALSTERAESTFDTLREFKNAIGNKADDAAINPMNYVNKIVVAYKNPGHNFNTPYITSIYSGLMLDNYA